MTTLGTETHHMAWTHAIVITSLIPRPVLPHSQLLLPHSTPRPFPGCSQHAQHKKSRAGFVQEHSISQQGINS